MVQKLSRSSHNTVISNVAMDFSSVTGCKGAKFVFVPEMHRDGAWHLHGLINDLPVDHLRPFTLEEKLPTYIRNGYRVALMGF